MENAIAENGRKVKCKEKVNSIGRKISFIVDNIKMISVMGKEQCIGVSPRDLEVISHMVSDMDMDSLSRFREPQHKLIRKRCIHTNWL